MRTPSWLVFFLSSLALWPGCRCGSSTPEEPAPAASTKPPSPLKCPAQPEWGAEQLEPEKLVVELLMVPRFESTRKGTGIRIYEDGRVFAFDEVYYETKEGKMSNRPIPGKWRQHRSVPAERIAELKAVLAKEDPADLRDWQGKDRKGQGKASHLNLRLGGEWVRGCYRGVEGGSAQQRVDKATKKIMGEAYDDAVNRNAN